jgi:hypothetical protein
MAALLVVAVVTGVVDYAQAGKKKGARHVVWHQWSVPFTCGLNDGDAVRAVPGSYAAAVNILNTEETEVMFTKHLSLTFPPTTQDPGAVSEPVIEALPAGSALQVDCGEILGTDFVFPVPPEVTSYVQGFLVVRAHSELDVAVTQTATAGVDGEVSVDVEKVEGRVVDGPNIDGDETVAVCHVPPGNPAAAHTIYVGAPAVPVHLGHGDYLGACE